MKRLAALGAGLLALFLTGYLVAEAFGVPWLAAPPPLAAQARPLAAAVGVGLLVGDALLPVPSSVVMIALGGIAGFLPAVGLALAGRVGGTMLGFAVGRLVASAVPRPPHEQAPALLRRWGSLAVVVTRPVPLVGETVAVLAGVSGMGWKRCTLAAAAGSLPEAVLYSWAGASARSAGVGASLWAALLATATVTWVIGRAVTRGRPRHRPGLPWIVPRDIPR